ncbi:hypothetical protein [Kitasatospora sp. NPDC051914]|uniref:hypothetical protein n=1 Tax=Kitasatospora sp. NPDC051914 TaxID=3154945 RepID=UPI003429461F
MRKSTPTTLLAIAVVTAGAALGVAHAAPTASTPAAPAPVAAARQDAPQPSPAPHVQDFAHGLGNSKKLPTSAGPAQVPDADGCDHGYGTEGQCVPLVFPPGVGDTAKDRCQWLKDHGFKELKVHDKAKGKDQLKLDKNKDNIACGKDDD